MSNRPPDFTRLRKQYYTLYTRASKHVGSIAVKHMQLNFRLQGWTPGNITLPWKNRKKREGRKKRAILIKSGALRRSIRTLDSGLGFVKIGTNMPYSKIHNEGGTIKTVQTIKAHTRREHTRKSGTKRRVVKESKVVSHTRKVNTTIPKRQFIGPSPKVLRDGEKWILTEIDKLVKKW